MPARTLPPRSATSSSSRGGPVAGPSSSSSSPSRNRNERTQRQRQSQRFTPVGRRPSRVDVQRDAAGDAVEAEGEFTHSSSSSSAIEGEDDEEAEGEEGDEMQTQTQTQTQRRASANNETGTGRGTPPPQPIASSSATLIKPLVQTWSTTATELESFKRDMRMAAVAFAESAEMNRMDEGGGDTKSSSQRRDAEEEEDDNEEQQARLTALEGDFKDIVDLAVESSIRQDVLNDLLRQVIRSNPADVDGGVLDASEVYKSAVGARLTEYRSKTDRGKYLHDNSFKLYKEAIWEATHDTPMPPLVEFLPAQQGDEEEEEEDFVEGGMRQDFKCPLTMALLEDPVTNTPCKHSYSSEAIHAYLAQNGRGGGGGNNSSAPCPRAGCQKNITKRSLVKDAELQRRVKAYKRRLEMREGRKGTQIID